jgi:hypothetical protein
MRNPQRERLFVLFNETVCRLVEYRAVRFVSRGEAMNNAVLLFLLRLPVHVEIDE